uniref:Uncharacterized protein n=1 Tax=Piliocolobus tephrosceles TaxID=591936 RepID=A0A8C9LJD9_9PRIM
MMGTRGPCWRFRFCGDLDCRDRVLAEIIMLAKMVECHLSPWCENILKLKADAKFESGDVKATVAVLSFILSSAAKHSVDGGCLSSELQRLGLPKEHAASVRHSYEEKQSPLQKHLGSATYAVSMRPASVRAHSRRCTQHPQVCLPLDIAHLPSCGTQGFVLSCGQHEKQLSLLCSAERGQTEAEQGNNSVIVCLLMAESTISPSLSVRPSGHQAWRLY